MAQLFAIAASQVQAEEALPEPFVRAWQACQDRMASQPDDWIGWRRDFFNGYGDNFAYWSQEMAIAGQPAVLRTETLIDSIHAVSAIYCFQADGRPALAHTVMTTVNSAEGPNRDARLKREGWVFFKPDGSLDRVIGRLVDDTGKSHRLDEADEEIVTVHRAGRGFEIILYREDRPTFEGQSPIRAVQE